MQCFKLPKYVCNNLLSAAINFLWSGNGRERSIHWTNKETILREKCLGGLGLRNPELFNAALLMKQAWRILTKPNLLWCKLLKARYFRHTDFLNASLGYSPSHAWRSLWSVKDILKEGLYFNETEGRYEWTTSSSGEFSCKSAYELIFKKKTSDIVGESSDSSRLTHFWRKLWCLKLPNKVKFFIWRLFHNGLPDAMNLIKRGCVVDKGCKLCGFETETVMHVVKDCWWCKVIWDELDIDPSVLNVPYEFPADWLWHCAQELDLRKKGEMREMGFAIIVKNENVYQNIFAGWESNFQSSRDAEGMALWRAMKLAESQRVDEAVFFSDCLEVIEAVMKGKVTENSGGGWVEGCFTLLESHRHWSLEHVFRHDNKEADKLANWARTEHWEWKLTDSIPWIFRDIRDQG
ncbi:hypothetical protein QQ045_000189 [Rhodiola kirilowii]